MASTDTAFVGHLDNSTTGAMIDEPHSAEQYLAAASLSDMVVNILIVPPLAFNQVRPSTSHPQPHVLTLTTVSPSPSLSPSPSPSQVLNALVGQALGSGNKKMAGTWLQLSVFFLTVSYVPFMVIQYLYVSDALRLRSLP